MVAFSENNGEEDRLMIKQSKKVITPDSNKQATELDILVPDLKSTYDKFIEQISFFKYIKDNSNNISPELLKAAASNLVCLGEEGRKCFHELVQDSPNYQQEYIEQVFNEAVDSYKKKMPPVSYETIACYGVPLSTGEHSTPIQELLSLKKDYDLRARGFHFNENGKIMFNANIFVKYVLGRVKIIFVNDVDYSTWDQRGYWRKIAESQLAKILREILHEASPNIWKKKYEGEYMVALQREVEHITELNLYKDYLNLENGMLNLKTMELEPHAPEFYSSIRVPISYNPLAKCSLFEQTLEKIMDGDKDRINLIQEIMGYFLTSERVIQKAFFFHGNGANGKSVLAEVIRHVCGKENVSNTPLSSLGSRFGLQNLPGKTLNISTENEFFDKYIDTQNFKAITGGDAVNVEQKYKQACSYELFCKLLVLINNMPHTRDNSHGYYRRIVLIPFNRTFTGEHADNDLLNKLLLELEGILIFALEGLKRLRNQNYNLTEPSAVEEALENYQREQNPVLEFFQDRVEIVSGSSTEKPKISRAFIKWCEANGNDNWARFNSQKFWELFKQVMRDNGVEYLTKKSQGTIRLVNVKIKKDLGQENNVNFNGASNLSNTLLDF